MAEDQKNSENPAATPDKPTNAAEPAAADKTEKNDKKAKAPSELETLREKVEALKAEVAAGNDKFLYLQADYQNYRRRVLKDIQDARINGTASALEPFLSINDFLAMAQQAAEQSDNVAAIKQGVQMIIGEYHRAMNELGVSRIACVGKKFDPAVGEAVSSEPSETVPEGVVIREFSGGYKMGERVLRAARVVVSSGKPKPAGEPAAEAPATEAKAEETTPDSGKEA